MEAKVRRACLYCSSGVGSEVDWMFGDFQSPKPNPDEHRIQPIEASQLVAFLGQMHFGITLAEAVLCQTG